MTSITHRSNMLKMLVYVCFVLLTLGLLAQVITDTSKEGCPTGGAASTETQVITDTSKEGCPTGGAASTENLDVCSSVSCERFSKCVGLDDGTHTCFCDVEMYSFLCGGKLRLCGASECNNAAQCQDAPDGSALCSCIPGTEGERCQYFTRNLGGSIHEIQTQVTDGSLKDGVPWSRDVCLRVPIGQSIEIDIGLKYAVNIVKVVVFSDAANLTLLATLGPGDTDGQLCSSHVGYFTYAAPRTFPCNGLSTRFLRLDVHNFGYIPTSLLMCVGGVVPQETRTTRTGMAKYVPQSGRQHFTTLESPSAIHCAVTCMEQAKCVTFTWDSGLCYQYERSSASSGSGFEGFSLTRSATGSSGC